MTDSDGDRTPQRARLDQWKVHREWATLALLVVYTIVNVGLWLSQIHNNNLTKRATLSANRAWLSVPFVALARPLEEGPPLKVMVRIANIGRTPALGMRWKIIPVPGPWISHASGLHLSDFIVNKTCDGLKPRLRRGTVIWPSTATKMWIPQSLKFVHNNRALIADISNHSKSLILEGCLVYKTFGESHTTAFTFFLRDVPGKPSTAWHFNVLPAGNAAD